MNKIYHVAPKNHEGDLLSLYAQYGDAAREMFVERWEGSEDYADIHADFVHCYASLDEALSHLHEGKIYEIDVAAMEDDYIEIERDVIEFDHPMVRDKIPAEYIKVVG
jgi:hypothetical protein